MKNFELNINPVEDYKAPELPTFEDNNSELLKKMPSRWKKNARIMAGLGLVSVFTISGCANPDITPRTNNIEHNFAYTQGNYAGYSEADLLVRLHTGGGGGSGYMVHLTEQEAFGIIRARLEAAGLAFDGEPPEDAWLVFDEPSGSDTEAGWYVRNNFNGVRPDLYDVKKSVGIINISWLGSSLAFIPHESEIIERLLEMVAEQNSNVTLGAFYNPGMNAGGHEIGDDGWSSIPLRPSDEEIAEARPILERQLINQADKFITHLQSEGILERFADIKVIINGVPFTHLGEYPIIINNYKMISAIELFQALGMDVLREINEHRLAITGSTDDIEIRLQVGLRSNHHSGSISINREWPPHRDIPVIMRDGIILAPLQFVAELTGATVHWNEDTRTITITTS